MAAHTGVLQVYCAHIAYVGQQCRLEMSAEWYIAWTKTHENDSVLGFEAGMRRAVVETARSRLVTAGARCARCPSHGTEICVAGKWQWGGGGGGLSVGPYVSCLNEISWEPSSIFTCQQVLLASG